MREAAEATAAGNGAGLVAENLAKTYRRRTVVDGVTVRILPGEVVGLLGPNGAGKTTSFYLILGLVPPSAEGSSSTAETSPPCRCT